MRRLILVSLGAVMAFVFAACQPSNEAYCERWDECQPETDLADCKTLTAANLKTAKSRGCDDEYEDWMDCQTGLSCEVLLDQEGDVCADEEYAMRSCMGN